MCIIIDADVAHQFNPASPGAKHVVDWIQERGGRLVIGGKNTEELAKNAAVARWIRVLRQAGRARLIRRELLEKEEAHVRSLALCFSNDLHLLALARVSGARIVFSNDGDLHTDFRNPALINNPRGHVYQTADHRHLLRDGICRG